MTNTTTVLDAARHQRRRSPLWWILPLSCALHFVVFGTLITKQVLTREIAFDREEFDKQTQEAQRRAAERDKRDRAARSQRALSPLHQQKLKQEIERRPRQEMIEHIKSLERSRSEIQIAKAARLEDIAERTEEEYRKMLIEQILAIAELSHSLAITRRGDFWPWFAASGDNVRKAAQRLPESSELRQSTEALSRLIDETRPLRLRNVEPSSESLEAIIAAAELVEQAATKNLSDTEEGEPAERLRSANEELADQAKAVGEATRFYIQANLLVGLAEDAVARAYALVQLPDDRDIAVGLHETALSLLEKSTASLVRNVPSSLGLNRAAVDLEEKVRQLLGDPPNWKEFNDISAAQRPHDPDIDPSELSESALRHATPQELYETAGKLAEEIEQHFVDRIAADLAIRNNISFNEAAAATSRGSRYERTDLASLLAQANLGTVGDANAHRRTIGTAADQLESLARRARFLAAQSARGGSDNPDGDTAFANAVGAGGKGSRSLRLFDQVDGEGGAHMTHRRLRTEHQYNYDAVVAQALPGRRFSKETPRTGWLYVDTWYVIGPWANGGRIDYTNVHPPESEIDFDAIYMDGKRGHFRNSSGETVDHDGTLRWRFTQCDTLRIRPYSQAPDSTFYAYTELYFEEEKELLVGSPSDDCVRVWINDELVRDEKGLAGWELNQSFYPVTFRKGANRVLIRLENGPGGCQFTFTLIPQKQLTQGTRGE